MNLEMDGFVLRNLKLSDAASLAKYANNHKIWINLRDAFPHPYNKQDAINFISLVLQQKEQTTYAIEVHKMAVGCIGYGIKTDVERVSAEIGYWIGEDFWNRGIVTKALKAVTKYAIEKHQLTRIYAVPFDWNDASFRVLEKAGYVLEGRLKRSAVKDGQIIDQLQYAYIVNE